MWIAFIRALKKIKNVFDNEKQKHFCVYGGADWNINKSTALHIWKELVALVGKKPFHIGLFVHTHTLTHSSIKPISIQFQEGWYFENITKIHSQHCIRSVFKKTRYFLWYFFSVVLCFLIVWIFSLNTNVYIYIIWIYLHYENIKMYFCLEFPGGIKKKSISSIHLRYLNTPFLNE